MLKYVLLLLSLSPLILNFLVCPAYAALFGTNQLAITGAMLLT